MDTLPAPPHMTPEQFRTLGHQMVDWIADLPGRIAAMPVQPPVQPGDIAARLPAGPPHTQEPNAWQRIFQDLDAVILPGLTHWQHPGFFAYFPCNSSGPGILGELAAAGLNVNGMLWSTSPAATELETRVLDWCAELFDLPHRFRSTGPGGGCIQGTASEATLVALIAARHRLRASHPGPFRVITSEQAHSSVTKAAMIAGVANGPSDTTHVTTLPTDAQGRMDLAALRTTLADPRLPIPAMVVATCGTTSTGAVDAVDAVAAVLREAGPAERRPWLHVDAAFNGAALVCPEHRWMAAGFEHADSLCINPHKWLLTNFDCDLFWIADRAALTAALSVTPEYLRNAQSDAGVVLDYRDWQVPLGRRFRALKLWFVLRHYGAEGLRAYIREHVAWAAWFEGQVRADPRFRLIAPRTTSLVCFALTAGDDATHRLLQRVNASGEVFLSHTRVSQPGAAPVYTARLAIGSTACRFEHVQRAWSLLSSHADAAAAP